MSLIWYFFLQSRIWDKLRPIVVLDAFRDAVSGEVSLRCLPHSEPLRIDRCSTQMQNKILSDELPWALWNRLICVLGWNCAQFPQKRHIISCIETLWLARIQCPRTDVYLGWERTVQSEGLLLKGIKARSPLSMTPSCKEISSIKF